ncbi:hypothetical protein [Amycolatopsis sp. cmx-4-83]|uniref:hypothetical protein n=1 Tax=Amycolatopsis sp. cmx-4-83 TaxID=2790940 RepID=UPI00397C24B1
MEIVKVAVSISALAIALLSFVVARLADHLSKKAEDIRTLLGDKESVAFGALKLLRDGIPSKPRDQELVMMAIMQACVFERSDRARALLYRVIELNRAAHHAGFAKALDMVEHTFASMKAYEFESEELDLERGNKRIKTVRKVLK